MREQQIKERVKERYGKIALTGNNSDCCCSGVSQEECASENGSSPMQSVKAIGYNTARYRIHSSEINTWSRMWCTYKVLLISREGETVVDLGSGAGIDVFLSAKRVGKSGKVIGIDMTDEMLEKARKNAKDNDYTTNVEFRKGDIEKRIPFEDNTVDLVISNCVINLTTDKVNTFKEIYRVLKKWKGRMIISDLVTER